MATTPTIKDNVTVIRTLSNKELRAFQKRDRVTDLIIRDLKKKGTFFNTPSGLFYFCKKDVPHLYPLEEDSISFAAFVGETYGLNRAEKRDFEHLMAGLEAEAQLRGQNVEVRRLAHFESSTNTLYVSRFDGYMYKLDGARLRCVTNGTDGVFFWDNPQWQPYRTVNSRTIRVFQRLIINSANFRNSGGVTAEDQRWVLKRWFLAQFFSSLHPTKPLLLVCGEKGGGKSSALRKWVKLLFGQEAELSALERGKADGFIACVTSQSIAVFDNVDEHVGWLPDHLAQLATGVNFTRRRYYTTNEQAQYRPCCWVALTSRTPRFIEGRDDVLDRTLILQTERRGMFRSEQILLEEIREQRNNLWTELLQELNSIVALFLKRGWRNVEVNCRMADFASFCLAISTTVDEAAQAERILAAIEGRQNEMLLRNEPISVCMETWLRNPANVGRKVDTAELNLGLKAIAQGQGTPWPHNSTQSLAQRLSHITTNLSKRFDVKVEHDTSNQCWYRFWPLGQSEVTTE
jgi:hypothetical protein